MGLFENAVRFAAERHSGAKRKSGTLPYLLHPMEVAVIVSSMADDEEILAAAVLHDTVEDTDTTLAELEELFGPRVAGFVASETENKRPEMSADLSWRIRKEESLDELRNATDPAVKILWLGDKLSNIRSLYRDWLQLGDRVWERFNQKDPAQQAWYYRSLDELIGDPEGCDAAREFHDLVGKLFPENN